MRAKVFQDWGMIVVSLGGIIYQQATGQVDLRLLALYATMLGLTGGRAVRSLVRLSGTTYRSQRSQEVDSDTSSQT